MSLCHISCVTFLPVSWLSWSDCLRNDDVAVFRFQLVKDDIIPSYLISLLQPDEINRAQQYHRAEDRKRFIYARSILRVLSGHYTNQSPKQIQFTAGTNKKPILSGQTGWHINVSHSGNWILLTIGKVSVGVDVEQINPQFSFQDVLPMSFSPEEQAYIEAGTDARLKFYQLWTRKEALCKATGKGMDDDFWRLPSLDGFHITESSLIGGTGNWMVKSFNASSDCQAAIAYQETGEMPKFYTFDSGLLAH